MQHRHCNVLFVVALSGALAACSSEGGGSSRYLGISVSQSSPLSSKANVTVNSPYGGVKVDTAGEPGMLTVAAVPFAVGPASEAGRAQAEAALLSGPQFMLTSDATAGVSVTSTGNEAAGLDLNVHLPNPFHGQLTVNAAFGNVLYLASPSSPGATFNVGTGDIDIENAGNQLTVHAGTSNVVLVAAPTLSGPDTKGMPTPPSVVTTNIGNITAKIPDASSLTIDAATHGHGTVRPQADQVVAQYAADGSSAQIVVGDGQSGSMSIQTNYGDVVFLRP